MTTVKLKTQCGTHKPGSTHAVVEEVPHGGYSDSAKQFVLADGTHVLSDNCEVVPEEKNDV